jgi:GTPase SAR1 family protein
MDTMAKHKGVPSEGEVSDDGGSICGEDFLPDSPKPKRKAPGQKAVKPAPKPIQTVRDDVSDAGGDFSGNDFLDDSPRTQARIVNRPVIKTIKQTNQNPLDQNKTNPQPNTTEGDIIPIIHIETLIPDVQFEITDDTEQTVKNVLANLRAKWSPQVINRTMTPYDVFNYAKRVYGITNNTTLQNIDFIKTQSRALVSEILFLRIRYRWLYRGNAEDCLMINVECNRFLSIVRFMEQMLIGIERTFASFNEFYEPNSDVEITANKLKTQEKDEMKPYTAAVLYLIQEMESNGIRRIRNSDGLCRQHKIVGLDGNLYDTFTWRQCDTIDHYVSDKFDKHLNYDHWDAVSINKKNFDQLRHYLMNVDDNDIPFLHKDRNLTSCRNMIFETNIYDPVTKTYHDRVINYGSDEYFQLDKTRVACKFFDADFTAFDLTPDQWREIPTPNFDKILAYQWGDRQDYNEIYDTICALIGRMRGVIGVVDRWQVTLLLKGVAGTGKSSIIEEIIRNMFELDDVGVITDDANARFGLENCEGKFIVIAPEVTNKLSLPQATFQEIVTGGQVTIDKKGIRHKTSKWTAHTVWGTNLGLGNYIDNGESIGRRVAPAIMEKIVKPNMVDPNLPDKLAAEMPNLIVKFSHAYLELANKYRGVGFWNFVPKYFVQKRRELNLETNPLKCFMVPGEYVEYDADYYCFMDDFREKFKEFCQSINYTVTRWNQSLYTPIFKQMSDENAVEIDVKVESRKFRAPDGSLVDRTGTVISGFRLLTIADKQHVVAGSQFHDDD